MRIRYKKWARPELEASKFYEDEPENWKGKWKTHFEDEDKPFMLELGCGKGQFISKLAVENQDINYLAIDLVDAMLGLAKRNIEQEYENEKLEPKNVMLTRFDIERIKVIGWAFDHYLSQEDTKIEKKKETDILMIADPLETDKLIDVCIILARNYPSINFYYRAHPGEILDERLKLKLTNENNIHLDDNSQNILVTLKGYTHVIGVNSTVLNEAVTYGKKVGILYLEGLHPMNIDGSENDFFWKINTIEAFEHFMKASPSEKKQNKIYTHFDKELFEKLIAV